MKKPTRFASLVSLPIAAAAFSLAAGTLPARAGELYLQAGAPGVMLGFAQPLNTHFGLRVDYATIGQRSERRLEDGINYDAKLKLNRGALLLDWFPLQGAFRFSGGITANQYRLDLHASGAGGSLTIGNNTYTTTAADQLSAVVNFPSSTPYFGFGWGHQSGTGLRFSMDVGAMFGKATVSYAVNGPLAQRVTQADIDAELAELRNGVGKVKFVPQLTLGMGYSF